MSRQSKDNNNIISGKISAPTNKSTEADELITAGKTDKAIEKLYNLIKKDPSHKRNYLVLSALLFNKRKYTESKEILLAGYKHWPDDPNFSVNITVNECGLKQYNEAIKWSGIALNIWKDCPVVYDVLSHSHGALGKLKEAKKSGAQSLKLKDKEACQKNKPKKFHDKIPKFNIDKPHENIISFSLFGADIKYVYGAIKNAKLIPHIYPGWTMRIYIEECSIPKSVVTTLIRHGAEVILMPKQQYIYEGLFWRFYAANDKTIKRFLIRDCDSIVNIKEKYAVDAWVASNKHFHVMRDYYTHTDLILAGLWGGVSGILPDLKKIQTKYLTSITKTANYDQFMLKYEIWPIIKQSVMIHDSVFDVLGARKFPKGAELPSNRHVGQNHFVRSDIQNFKSGNISKGNSLEPRRQMFSFIISPENIICHYFNNLLNLNVTKSEDHYKRTNVNQISTHCPTQSEISLYNNIGNTLEVREFWLRKYSGVLYGEKPTYIETNPQLFNAGLLENWDLFTKNSEMHILILQSNVYDTIYRLYNSYIFHNPAFAATAALSPEFKRNAVNFKPFEKYGIAGKCYWYICEIDARAKSYKEKLKAKKNLYFHEINLDKKHIKQSMADICSILGEPKEAKDIELPQDDLLDKSKLTDNKIKKEYQIMIKEIDEYFKHKSWVNK